MDGMSPGVLATQEQDPYLHVFMSAFTDPVEEMDRTKLGTNMRLLDTKDDWYEVGGGPVYMRRLTFVNSPNAV